MASLGQQDVLSIRWVRETVLPVLLRRGHHGPVIAFCLEGGHNMMAPQRS